MVSYFEYNAQYTIASQALTNALSELAESVDTLDFNRAFWKVQRASKQCKQVRETAEEQRTPLHEASVIMTS